MPGTASSIFDIPTSLPFDPSIHPRPIPARVTQTSALSSQDALLHCFEFRIGQCALLS